MSSIQQPGILRFQPIYYHRDMHLAIWNWIRRWCERDNEDSSITEGLHPAGWDLSPKTPTDILLDLSQLIDVSEDSLYPDVVEGGEGNLAGSYLYDFAHAVCREGQRLKDSGLQFKMSWITMQQIINYYHRDLVNYIRDIDSLRWSSSEQNDFFELGLDTHVALHTISASRMKDILTWNRYLTGRYVYIWTSAHHLMGSPEFFEQHNTSGDSIEAYWADLVFKKNYTELTGFTENPFEDSDANIGIDFSSDEISSDEDDEENAQPLTEEQAKKNAAIRKLQESLDSVQEDIGDGLYLEIMNLMKDNYVVT